MMFLLSIRFLDDRYHGTTDNGETTEWPPSPFRVFQALVAGNAKGDRLPDNVRDALIWLERLNPPDIIAPRASDGALLLTYVLNNVSDSDFNSRTPKLIRPTILNDDRLVEYAWQFNPSPESDRCIETLIGASRHIRALGWGIDLAIGHGEAKDKLPQVSPKRCRYVPAQTVTANGKDRRVPRPGSLDSLEETYRQFLGRYETPGVTAFESAGAIYDTVQYGVGGVRPCVAFRIVDEMGDTVAIKPQLITPLVGMIRNLANDPRLIARIGQESIDRDFKGHPKAGSKDRVSILPLPTVRDGPTDGRVRRVILAQPASSGGALCRAFDSLFDGVALVPEADETRLKGCGLERIRGRDLVVPRYVGTSCVWASVTPVLLPGYDDRKQHRGDHVKRLARAEELCQKALAQSGLPPAKDIQLSRVPYFVGSQHVRDYRVRAKLNNYPRYHVRLEFDQLVTGPVAIGAGRHTGFGTCAIYGSRE